MHCSGYDLTLPVNNSIKWLPVLIKDFENKYDIVSKKLPQRNIKLKRSRKETKNITKS